jgi:flagellar protein FlaF
VNAHSLAQNAYAQSASSTRTLRDTEYRIIARVSHRLKSAAEASPQDFPALAAALNDNRRLWDTLAIDVANPQNQLPKDLRARIFFLAQFVNKHTAMALSRKAEVGPLLEINAAILKGLSTKGTAR